MDVVCLVARKLRFNPHRKSHQRKHSLPPVHQETISFYLPMTQISTMHTPRRWQMWYLTMTSIGYKLEDESWWRHQMETFSALLGICAWNSPVSGEFPHKASKAGFDVFFDLLLKKSLSKQKWGWWFETQSHPLGRHWMPYNIYSMPHPHGCVK